MTAHGECRLYRLDNPSLELNARFRAINISEDLSENDAGLRLTLPLQANQGRSHMDRRKKTQPHFGQCFFNHQ
jgi:hypothetical protein